MLSSLKFQNYFGAPVPCTLRFLVAYGSTNSKDL